MCHFFEAKYIINEKPGSDIGITAKAINDEGHNDHYIHETLHYEAEGLEMSESKRNASRVKRRLQRRREDVTVDIV